MTDRRTYARALREQAAHKAFDRQHSQQLPSGEETAYVYNGGLSYAGSFTKGLPHDPQTGLADPSAFRALVHAIATTHDSDYALVPYGAPKASRDRSSIRRLGQPTTCRGRMPGPCRSRRRRS